MHDHLFFDLDHTLWDFERNSTESLKELYQVHQMQAAYGFSEDAFLTAFVQVNHQLWSDYNDGKIDRKVIRSRRFEMVFEALDSRPNENPKRLSDEYLSLCPKKPHTLPYTFEVLDYLKGKGYPMHIITNGFDDVQAIKLKASGLAPYFDVVVTSETCGHKKPSPEIFHHAVGAAGVSLAKGLMVGDNLETDIAGAQKVGMPQVFYNPRKHVHSVVPTYEIHSLLELTSIL